MLQGVIGKRQTNPNGNVTMKELSSVIAVLAMLVLSGCGGESAASPENADSIDCAVEIQIAVVSGRKPGDEITEGDWRVAAACALPVHSTGGPGHVMSNTNGTIIELQWTDVRMMPDGKRIEFGGGRWRIRNRIDRRDGNSQTLAGGASNPPLSFATDFEWLGSCDLDTAGEQDSDRKLVIRGRLLPKVPPARPLNLEEAVGPGLADRDVAR